jgi:lipase
VNGLTSSSRAFAGIASAFCAAYPDRVSGLVFFDGGYAPEMPAGTDPDQLLAVMLGPFLEKLRREWSSLDEYIA